MMAFKSSDRREFYVVQFIELPREDIDDYVCVPYTWLALHRVKSKKAVVAYPKDEDPFDTRDRARQKERYRDEWKFYMSEVKYESNSYEDAEFWIATRNDYEPVEPGSEVKEKLPCFKMSKRTRSASKKHSSKSHDNHQVPLPRISNKRPGSSETKKQVDKKRLKLDNTGPSTSAGFNHANAEPGCSKAEVEKNLNVQSILVDRSVLIRNDNKDVQSTSTVSQKAAVQPEPVRKVLSPIIPNANDISNTASTPYHLPNSLKADLYRSMDGARYMVAMHPPLKKRIQMMENTRKLDIAAQSSSNLIDPTTSGTYENQIERGQFAGSKESKVSQQITSTKVPPTQQNPLNLSEHCQQSQSQLNQQNSLQQPKIRINITFKSNSNEQKSDPRRVTQNKPQPVLTEGLDFLKQALSTESPKNPDNELQTKTLQSGYSSAIGRPVQLSENQPQLVDWLTKESSLKYHETASDSDTTTDSEDISDHEMLSNETPFVASNTSYHPGIVNESIPTSFQNSTSPKHQMHSKATLEKEIMDMHTALTDQMRDTLRYQCEMYNTLRNLIQKNSETYKKLLAAVNRLQAMENRTGNFPFVR